MWFSTGSRRLTRVLGWLAALGLLAGLVLALGVAPREVSQGNVQRIMYLHVPSILTAYLAFAIVLVASLGYLVDVGRASDLDRGDVCHVRRLPHAPGHDRRGRTPRAARGSARHPGGAQHPARALLGPLVEDAPPTADAPPTGPGRPRRNLPAHARSELGGVHASVRLPPGQAHSSGAALRGGPAVMPDHPATPEHW